MALRLYAHPFSMYSQKALIALYENATPFEFRLLDRGPVSDELAALWPLKRFPVLQDGDKTVLESTIIIEHLGLFHPGPVRLIPNDPGLALDARMMDRIFDNYVATPLMTVVADSMRAPGERDAKGVADARAMLATIYGWLDQRMAGRTWASGDTFSLADCAAGPALFYADWTHPIAPDLANLHAYRRRLLARPSFARAVDEARPFRSYFPLGAPDRD